MVKMAQLERRILKDNLFDVALIECAFCFFRKAYLLVASFTNHDRAFFLFFFFVNCVSIPVVLKLFAMRRI